MRVKALADATSQAQNRALCQGNDYLSVATLPQDAQQLEALRSDALCALIDVVLGYLDLLAVIHVAAVRHVRLSIMPVPLFDLFGYKNLTKVKF